ncbi:hypothetical protein L1887_23662 [Cichorium endivia]|nr:hypothetical protein L1887_23662 [Cichorium endivia]
MYRFGPYVGVGRSWEIQLQFTNTGAKISRGAEAERRGSAQPHTLEAKEMAGENTGREKHPPPSAPDSPTSDQLPFNVGTPENYFDYEDDDPNLNGDVLEERDEDEQEDEDFFNDNYIEDYGRIDDLDEYESVGLDDSLEEEEDLDQIMADCEAAETELDASDCFYGQDDDSLRPSKRTKADMDDTNAMLTCPGRSQKDVLMTDHTDAEDDDNDKDESNMHRVQGTIREWVARDEAKAFKHNDPFLGPFLQTSYSEEVGSCIHCQSKEPFTINIQQTIFRNYHKLTLQEIPDIVPGRLPRHVEVILLNDLVDCAHIGEEIEVTGIYADKSDSYLNTKNGFSVFATVIEANYVTKKQDRYSADKLTREEKAEIVKLSKDSKIVERTIKSIAPSIYGHDDIKTAIAFALFGGQEKNIDGTHLRGDIHVLLDVVDPTMDETLATFVVDSHLKSQTKGVESEILSQDMLKKYITRHEIWSGTGKDVRRITVKVDELQSTVLDYGITDLKAFFTLGVAMGWVDL